ncbi:hypothetical protein E1B28_001846 [Marasmius oreades]|uniref:F-box domain-containing protein n=1 Tax=Marasmius oreades TaxID=181124 RepID=A0A9P8AFM0_9AGAR|nr:uncharacterized protein E1B28_001846 [Marasmius oreades]KAG7100061.1 hypothetical protein E1B28_001846 [Marasmius oreades]
MDNMGNLCVELILYLIRWLDSKDLKNIRLVNKNFSDTTEHAFWSTQTVRIIMREESLEPGIRKFEDFRNNIVSAGKIQRLKITSSVKDTEAAVRLLEAGLPEALCTLQGLRAIRWKVTSDDLPWIQGAILQSLASLPLVTKLFLYTNREEKQLPPISFDLFRNGKLEELSVSARFADRKHYISSLSKLLVQNPNIALLHLHAHNHEDQIPLRFKDLFSTSFPQPLQLKSLSVHGSWLIEFPHVITHLQSLSSLEIFDCQRNNDSDFWGTLQTQKVHIRHISTSRIHDELLDYLSSFSGLKTLRISVPSVLFHETAGRLAQRLYGQVLSKHRSTLRNVVIHPFLTSRTWYIGSWNMNAFDNCSQLRSLRVRIHEENIFESSDLETHVVAVLVRRVSALPALRTLRLEPQYLFHSHGYARSMTRSREGTALVENILQNMKLALTELPRMKVVHMKPYAHAEPARYLLEMVHLGEVRLRSENPTESTGSSLASTTEASTDVAV